METDRAHRFDMEATKHARAVVCPETGIWPRMRAISRATGRLASYTIPTLDIASSSGQYISYKFSFTSELLYSTHKASFWAV